MSPRVTVQMDDGEVVAVKTATSPDEVSALAYETELLQQVSHPGVVELIDQRITERGAELRMRHAGESLESWRGSVQQAGALAAAVATTLADLHHVDVVHGRVDAEHVLIGSDGRPRLCGFSPPPDQVTAADDVAGLGRVLEHLLRRTDNNENPRLLRSRRPDLAKRKKLELQIAHATDSTPTRRPSARAFARAVLAAVPDAQLAEPPRPDDVFGDQTTASFDDLFVNRPWDADDVDDSPRQRVRGVVGVSAFIILALATLGVMIRSSRATELPDPEPAQSASPSSTTTSTAAVAPTNGVIEIDGVRWKIGEPGDAVILGDWDCDSVATPAVYRPSSGAVFVFTGWSDGDHTVSVEPVARIPGGRSIRTATSSEPGCELLEVELPDGEFRSVEL